MLAAQKAEAERNAALQQELRRCSRARPSAISRSGARRGHLEAGLLPTGTVVIDSRASMREADETCRKEGASWPCGAGPARRSPSSAPAP
jgi:hypothetical protein